MHIERTVNVREVNPYLLGLNLTSGAIAVDLAALLYGQSDSSYLFASFLILLVITLCLGTLIMSNQQAAPNQTRRILVTAAGSIFLGTVAIVTTLLLLILGHG